MQRWIKELGYVKFTKVACEAAFRVPTAPSPKDVFAGSVWANDLPKSLAGKTFAITGSSRGMGLDLAKKIAERGGNLILLNRSSADSTKAREEIAALNKVGSTVLIDCDLCDFASVRAAAAAVRKNTKEIDALVLNAGLMAQKDIRTKDGYDKQMQANHLSHFLLTSLLFDLLEAASAARGEARVVSHSSGARKTPMAPLFEDSFETAWKVPADEKEKNPCMGDGKPMAKWQRYQQSKRANLAFTYALADYAEKKGSCRVKALCAHPGATNSGLQSRTDASCWLDNLINGLAAVAGHSTADGCLGLALATVKDGVSNGDFFGPAGVTGNAVLLPSEREQGYDQEQLRMLWAKSVAATGATW